MTTYYTYVDYTADDHVPFYVGKGNDVRTRDLRRNKHHINVINKHGIIRDVVIQTSVEEIAFNEEIRLIAELHTFVDDPEYNGLGCNYTPGGEGHTPCKAEKLRRSAKLKECWALHYEKYCSFMRGVKKSVPHTVEWHEAHSKAISGENNPNYGKHLKPETCELIRQANIGKIPWNKGKSVTYQMKSVTIIDGAAVITYPSIKAAAEAIGPMFGLTPGYVKTKLVARKETFRNLRIEYESMDHDHKCKEKTKA